MLNKNKYGLSRRIPNPIAREIRQRCGFGCVICGLAFYDYEHFDPDFANATEHNPAGMTLLCSQCNQKRARGRLSAEIVARHNANPKCKQQGYSSELFDFGLEPIRINFAGVSFFNCTHLIVVNGCPILTVTPPADAGQPVRLSGQFTDSKGRLTLKIQDNEFSVGSTNWDVDCIGPRITIRRGLGDISLVLKMNPPNELIIEILEMQSHGVFFRGNSDILEISRDGGRSWNSWSGCSISNCQVGISIDNGRRAVNDRIYDLG
ncbi:MULTISPECIES: hypothetical protein [unclassified Undibacterium]|uniref:hypothetical protein n=1 Tax=unclassified Undibacterium TaxID=2630295 RepID=UPI002AC93535|nr:MULTISPECIES: hypothetical protein [unclassified Undibacterium]MEB0140322.1 hypothetical protein [Undibacterium sp. CCC2.1]MEB0174258.1 hypothetical protein [Undibacterium sp. CCC1.1]MEB0177230.1 hypothetical protein [Undibacterium sp. CCC3.4]MEB0216495.1 hypothetical protein [Undibacterium sp. 5I2]WPX43265.1 hypothetical protein RHM61_18075 [Undibacterium sp. CCC3.4]